MARRTSAMCVVISDEDYRALQERIADRKPKCCPRCFSDSDFTPNFDPDGAVYACDGDNGCGHIWSPE